MVHKIINNEPQSLLLAVLKVEFVGLLIKMELVHLSEFGLGVCGGDKGRSSTNTYRPFSLRRTGPGAWARVFRRNFLG